MKINRKTELRKLIKDAVGNTMSLNNVWFYNDGSWVVCGSGTFIEGSVLKYRIDDFQDYIEPGETWDKNITMYFREIEKHFNG